MGIDPVTHKPFSKLIADYGNIGGSQKPSSPIGSFDKDFKNAIQLRSESYQTMPQGSRNTNNQPNQPPKMETIGNSFSISTSIPSDNLPMIIVPGASNYIDLENETVLPTSIYEEGEASLSKTSSPSASSTCSTSAQEALPVPFSWNDFLLEEVFAQTGDDQEQEIVGGFMSNDMVSQMENVTSQSWNKKDAMSSSSDISFLEAMLDQENEMFLSFPHLMEEPSNY